MTGSPVATPTTASMAAPVRTSSEGMRAPTTSSAAAATTGSRPTSWSCAPCVDGDDVVFGNGPTGDCLAGLPASTEACDETTTAAAADDLGDVVDR